MGNALDALKALATDKPAPAGTGSLIAGLDDPALKGAKREKNTVHLGVDPKITDRAKYCANLKMALEQAEADFKVAQAELRDYGADKRKGYNKAFKTNVTTVGVPYTIEVPKDEDSATPGRETRVVQVVCTNKYSVEQEAVLNLKPELGETYDKLFEEETTKTLRGDAEDLIRNLLKEVAGLNDAEVTNSMEKLFETKVKVKTTKNYEAEIEKTTEDVQTILAQSVVRVAPALKFPT